MYKKIDGEKTIQKDWRVVERLRKSNWSIQRYIQKWSWVRYWGITEEIGKREKENWQRDEFCKYGS